MLPRALVTPFRTATIWATLARQQFDWDKSTQIISGLFLGSIPIRKAPCGTRRQFCNTIEQINDFIHSKNPEAHLSLIVSVVEPDELEGTGFLGVETITRADLNKHHIERNILNMCDHDRNANVDIDDAIAILSKMHKVIESNKSVYVHCKAGCERSAMLCAIYLAAYVKKDNSQQYYTLDEAIQLLQSKRKQVSVTGGKLIRAKEILHKIYQSRMNTAEENKTNVQNSEITPSIQKPPYHPNFWNKRKMIAITAVAIGTALTASIYQGY